MCCRLSACRLLVAPFALAFAHGAAPIVLPIEILGTNGAFVAVALDFPTNSPAHIHSVWLQAHGLTYQEKASLQFNEGPWNALRNDNPAVSVAQPGRGYGGIGGGFQTLKLTIALTNAPLLPGPNILRFRFNQTDNRSSGWRVLRFNLLDAAGAPLLPPASFAEEDPASWTPPLSSLDDAAAGAQLWAQSELVDHPGGPPIRARCADCHAHDGRDLKFFNYSNRSIVERSIFHGLSRHQGEQIASYIRRLAMPAPGRPWNPPFQPGPGLDRKPAIEWSAGAGIDWVLDSDKEVAAHLPGGGTNRLALADPTRRIRSYNVREIPLAMQFLDWNRWLPAIHPLDSAGPQTFTNHGAFAAYLEVRRGLEGQRDITPEDYILGPMRSELDRFKQYVNGDDDRLYPTLMHVLGGAATQESYTRTYAGLLWSGVKLWELMHEFDLQERGLYLYGVNGEKRQWFSNRHIFNFAPHIISNDNARSKRVVFDSSHDPLHDFNYVSDAWYELQMILNPGARNAVKGGHHDDDWKYLWFFTEEGNDRYEPLQALSMSWKSMQEIDHGWGPDGRNRGPGDNGWWGFTFRDGRPSMGNNHNTTWPDHASNEVKPLLQTIYTVWIERIASFTLDQWAQANFAEFNRARDYRWGTSDVNESVPDQMRTELDQFANRYALDDALVNAWADYGAHMWPSNDWIPYYRPVDSSLTPPTALTASPGADHIDLSWDPVPHATSYNILRSNSPDERFVAVALFQPAPSYRDRLLDRGHTYRYRISANRNRSVSAPSLIVSAQPIAGRVAHWTFDEPSGSVAGDAGPIGLPGSLIGPVSRRAGPDGGLALQLDGRSYVSVPENLGRWLSGTFTLSAWIATTNRGHDDLIYAPTLAGSTQHDIHDADRMALIGALDASGRLGVRLKRYGPDVKTIGPIHDGQWHHIAITRDHLSGDIALYVDGAPQGQGTLDPGFLYKRAWSLGAPNEHRPSNLWRGSLDDVQLFNHVLDPAAVAALATAQPAPPLLVAPDEVFIPAGGTEAFEVRLSSPPTNAVSVTASFAFGDPDLRIVSGTLLEFSQANWNQPQLVRLAATADEDVVPGTATIRLAAPNMSLRDVIAVEGPSRPSGTSGGSTTASSSTSGSGSTTSGSSAGGGSTAGATGGASGTSGGGSATAGPHSGSAGASGHSALIQLPWEIQIKKPRGNGLLKPGRRLAVRGRVTGTGLPRGATNTLIEVAWRVSPESPSNTLAWALALPRKASRTGTVRFRTKTATIPAAAPGAPWTVLCRASTNFALSTSPTASVAGSFR